MIFNDGQAMKTEPGDVQDHRVLDNLIHRREIPVMLGVFIYPGRRPDDFRMVITFIGSFTDIRGGHIYPELVVACAKKPIRIFMQDGRNDNRRPNNLQKDFFYQDFRLKDALAKKGYYLNFTWSMGNHGQKHGGAIFRR